MNLKIRKATVDDAKTISDIWEVICAEKIYSAVSKPFTAEQEKDYISSLSEREGIFLGEVNDKIVGFQTLDLWAKFTDSFDHVGTIGTLILPQWRGKGIGRKLARFTFNFAKSKGYEKLIIYVRANNIRAQKFYSYLGFTTKGILSNQVKINGNYDDEIFMELFL